jgi:hypothetical protein
MIIARETLIFGRKYSVDVIKDYSLLNIVENVKFPDVFRGIPYSCDGILNKNDMFDDEPLTNECIMYFSYPTLIELLPDCLIKIIRSFVCGV